jgi:F-type H+-transporting ATPase subunit delta
VTAGRDAVVRGYAEALFSIAEAEGELAAVEDELYSFAKVLERETKLREALTDQALPTENRTNLIRDVLGERANPHTVSILGFLVEQGRAKDLDRIIEGLAEVAAERRRHVVAEVRSAVPLDDRRRARLAKALSKATGRSVEIKVVVDPTVVGGVVARIGNEVFDGTVRARLAEARRHLSGA